MEEGHKHIIFCIEHYNPLGIVRSLGESGICPIAIILNGGRPLVSKSRYLSKVYKVNSIKDGYDLLVREYANNIGSKAFIYTADDQITSYLDQHYDELKDFFIFFNAGANGRVTHYMNKRTILECAHRHGLSVLDNVVVKRGEIPEGLSYPLITKAIVPTINAWKSDMIICNSEDELKDAYNKITSEMVLLQKYIYKKNEYCMEGFSVNKGKEIFISIASTYNYLIPNSYSPYMTVRNFDKVEIQQPLNEMFQEIGFEGIFEIEFLVDKDDKLYFGEINFRNSTWSYASTCGGMNLPILWSNSMLTGTIEEGSIRKIPNNFTAMVEINDYNERVKTHRVNVFVWIRQLLECKCRYYIGKKDIKPVISIIASKVLDKLAF